MKYMIVLPTYNEKDNIEKLIKTCLSVGDEFEAVVIDDNSPDGTGVILDKLVMEFPKKVHVIHRNNDRGRGTAVIEGFKFSLKHNADLIFEMDADFSHDPCELKNFIKAINEGYDVVIGSRYIKGGRSVDRSAWRRLVSNMANFYNRLILGLWPIKDISSGFRCYTRKVLSAFDFNAFISKGYSGVAETLFYIKQNNFKIKEIPIIFVNRKAGSSKCGWIEYVRCIFVLPGVLIKSFLRPRK